MLYGTLSSTKAMEAVVWTPDKSPLVNAVLLAHPDSDAPVAQPTDASDLAVVEQRAGDVRQPLVFLSHKVHDCEQK